MVQFLWLPPKYPKFHHTPPPQKIFFLNPPPLLPPPTEEIQNLEPKQMAGAYLYKKISEHTPPPPSLTRLVYTCILESGCRSLYIK